MKLEELNSNDCSHNFSYTGDFSLSSFPKANIFGFFGIIHAPAGAR